MAARRAPSFDPTLSPALAPATEAFVADLARAAYDVALRHGITGPFADLELAMWRELRAVVGGRPVACCGDAA